MTTLAELVSDVRSHLDESVAGMWSNDELARWCWEATRDVARRTEWNKKSKTYDVVGAQQTYTLPPDLFRVHRCVYRQSTTYGYSLEWMEFAMLDDVLFTTSGGTPSNFTIWGQAGTREHDQLYLYPTPSASITGGLVLYYYAIPTKLDTNNYNVKAEIPNGWEDLVPLYVEVVARRKEARDSRWQEAQVLYEQRLEDFMRVSRHPSDQENFMAYGGQTGGLPGWLVDKDAW